MTAKLRADANSLRVIAANATIAPETFTDAAKEKDDIAALLDALANERDEAQHWVEEWREMSQTMQTRAEQAERERDEARRMLKRYGVHSPRCAKNRWPKAGETFAECDCGYDRASEAGKETKGE